MITNNKPLSIFEVKGLVGKDEMGKELTSFIKKFGNLNVKEAKELKEKLSNLKMMKINDVHICKITDFLPSNEEDLNKVVADANLDEDETKKILDTVKEFK